MDLDNKNLSLEKTYETNEAPSALFDQTLTTFLPPFCQGNARDRGVAWYCLGHCGENCAFFQMTQKSVPCFRPKEERFPVTIPGQCTRLAQFQTKMVKLHSLFQTRFVQKPYPLMTQKPIWPQSVSTPPPPHHHPLTHWHLHNFWKLYLFKRNWIFNYCTINSKIYSLKFKLHWRNWKYSYHSGNVYFFKKYTCLSKII